MKKISLSVGERLLLINEVGGLGDGLSLIQLGLALGVVDQVNPKDAEKEEIDWKVEDGRVHWNVEKEKAWEFTFEEETLRFIRDVFKKKDKDAKYSISDGRTMLNLVEKFNSKENVE